MGLPGRLEFPLLPDGDLGLAGLAHDGQLRPLRSAAGDLRGPALAEPHLEHPFLRPEEPDARCRRGRRPRYCGRGDHFLLRPLQPAFGPSPPPLSGMGPLRHLSHHRPCRSELRAARKRSIE